jgi:hypothetical protein
MQSKDRFDQIDFRLDRLVGAVLTLAETVSFVKDDLTHLKAVVQQQVLFASAVRSTFIPGAQHLAGRVKDDMSTASRYSSLPI